MIARTLKADALTPWFRWPVRPVRVGWYEMMGWMMDPGVRMYWNGKQWGYWEQEMWISWADVATDRWRGLARKP